MTNKRIKMNQPLQDIYKGKEIYIYHETFEANPYLIVSYSGDGTKKFKLGKDEFNQ